MDGSPKATTAVLNPDTSAALLDQVSKLNETLDTVKITKGEETPAWKATFSKWAVRFAIALAVIAVVGLLVGAGYAAFTIGLLNPVTLITASAAGLAIVVGLIAYGIWKLNSPAAEKANEQDHKKVIIDSK